MTYTRFCVFHLGNKEDEAGRSQRKSENRIRMVFRVTDMETEETNQAYFATNYKDTLGRRVMGIQASMMK